MKRLVMACVLVLFVFAGCGSDSDAPDDPLTEDTTGHVGRDKNATDASNYDIAYSICGTASTDELVNDLGAASSDPADIADAYAEGYTEAFQQAAYEGCLDALTGQSKEWP